MLNKKKILLFAPAFFGYYREIEKELRHQGAAVDTILENFSEKSIMYRLFWVKNDMTKTRYTESYYKKRIGELDKEYDIIFVVRGEALSEESMTQLKEKYPSALFIMYQWDSINNNKNCLKIERYFDQIFTFDAEDACKKGWCYRPLFYVEENSSKDTEKKIDFSMIGTLYYKRAELLKKVKDYCSRNHFSLYSHIYSPQLVYILHRCIMRDRRYRDIPYEDVKFYPLGNDALCDIYEKTAILVDYTADDQTGLTMRTIESIGHRCKLITNNKKIKESDIYKSGNIYIYDLERFDIPIEFVDRKYNELPETVREYYSLSGWIKSIFNID